MKGIDNKKMLMMGAIIQGDDIKERAIAETLEDPFVSDIYDFVSDPSHYFMSITMMDAEDRESAIEDIIRMGIDNYIRRVSDLVSDMISDDPSGDTIEDLPFQ